MVDCNQEAYDKLVAMSNRRAKHPEIVQVLKKQKLISTSQFKMTYVKDEGIYFQSVYKSLDDMGRHIAYMFFCNTNDIEQACETFRSYSEKAARKIEENELKIIDLLFNLNRYALWVGVTVLVAFVLWKVLN